MRLSGKWAAYAQLMQQHLSIEKIAERLGITRMTAWRWRHRLLRLPAASQAESLGGVIEADETFFRTSYKGSRGWKKGAPPENRRPRYRGDAAVKPGLSAEQVPVLTALDRSGGIVEAVLGNRSDSAIEAALAGKVAQGSVICSDGLKAYVKVAVNAGGEHRRIHPPRKNGAARAKGGKPRRKGRLGLGQVNGHHERLKTFINRQIRGVSTRYLPLYLGWLRAIRNPGFSPVSLIEQALATPR
jgi:hypothetical protein